MILFHPKMSMSSDLLMDQANLTVSKNTSSILYLWGQAVDCYMCNLTQLLTIEKNSGESIILETDHSWNLTIRDHENHTICSLNNLIFGEHGTYQWNVSDLSCSTISNRIPPENELKPIFYTLACVLCSMLIWRYCKFVYCTRSLFRRRVSERTRSEVESDIVFPDDVNRLLRQTPIQKEKTNRIKSLDVFRGITLALMIFVNYGGGGYWFFEHSPWNGLTIADVIFPWFAWIMGVGIAIKIKSELRNSITKLDLFKKICARALTLILLGIIITNLRSDDLKTIRFTGVLQRLGLSYFIVAVLESQFMKPQSTLQDARYAIVEDFLESYYQWSIVLFLTALHLLITFFVHAPECPKGYLGPGGIQNPVSNFNCTGGAAGYIDRLIFVDQAHLYQRPTCQKLYKCIPYDPEGLLGTFTTVLCVYLGVHAGRIILVFKETSQRVQRWMFWSLATGSIAGFLCEFSKENGWIPINKNLWSLSYVLLCCSSAFVLLSILLILIDKKRWWNGAPFYQVGMNSILIYIGHVITKDTFPWQWKVFDESSHLEYFIQDIWATMLWVIIAVLLHQRNVFVTL